MKNHDEDFDKLIESLTYQELEKYFSKTAIDHMMHPRNTGKIENASGYGRITGPCGDTIEMWVKVEDGTVKEATFMTDGCRPACACGSMATELAKGKTVAEATCVSQQDVLNAFDGFPEETEHCALLAVNTLKKAIGDCNMSISNRQNR